MWDSENSMAEMKTATEYRPIDFARRTGVTVRALHHYDRLGLLKPSHRTAAGYRLYGPADLARLQQVVTLKFIGFSLQEIKRLLAGADLATALQLQRNTLEQKRRRLELTIDGIKQAERLLSGPNGPKWEAFGKIIEAVQMQTNTDWTKKYYNAEAQKLLKKRRKLWSPKLQAEMEADWAALLKDIEAAARNKVEPPSSAAQALAERHAQLVSKFTGGSAAIGQGLTALWKDRANWPKEFQSGVFEPFARRGVRAAKGDNPALLSEAGRKFLAAVLKARWVNKYFDNEARKALVEGKNPWSQELQKEWASLRKDIERAAQDKVEPSSRRAIAVTRRHAKLMERLTGGNAYIGRGSPISGKTVPICRRNS